MRRIFPAFMMVIASLPTQAQRNSIAEHECFKSGGHADARKCLEQRANQSLVKVNQAETSFRSAIQKWDEEQRYKSESVRWLAKSKSSFQQYRQSQCELQAALAAGGNGAGDRRLLCIIELNEKRTVELDEAITSLQ